MKAHFLLSLSLIMTLIFHSEISAATDSRNAKSTSSKGNVKNTKSKTAAPILNVDNLPPLEDIVKSIQLEQYLPNFYKMGIVDTRILVRLGRMDFHMMEMEWPNITKHDIAKLKETVDQLVIEATVVENVEESPENIERKKLQFGRLQLPDFVQSFEYISASFGSTPPFGLRPLSFSLPEDGCNPPSSSLSGYIWVVKRGACAFVKKAQNAREANASVLMIINNEDRLDPIVSGLGIDPNITEKDVLALASLSVISVSNTTLEPLRHSIKSLSSVPMAQIIPIKCGAAAVCAPVTKEEKDINLEVSSGKMRLGGMMENGLQSYDFLTSNFGGRLPIQPLFVRLASPIDGCSMINNTEIEVGVDSNVPLLSRTDERNFALVVNRGGCRFDIKAKNAQELGASVLIIIDTKDAALQRVGGLDPHAGYIGIPSIIVTSIAGIALQDAQQNNESFTIELTPSTNGELANIWIELAYASYAEEDNDQILQIEGLMQKYAHASYDVLSWLRRKSDAIKSIKYKSIDAE